MCARFFFVPLPDKYLWHDNKCTDEGVMDLSIYFDFVFFFLVAMSDISQWTFFQIIESIEIRFDLISNFFSAKYE